MAQVTGAQITDDAEFEVPAWYAGRIVHVVVDSLGSDTAVSVKYLRTSGGTAHEIQSITATGVYPVQAGPIIKLVGDNDGSHTSFVLASDR